MPRHPVKWLPASVLTASIACLTPAPAPAQGAVEPAGIAIPELTREALPAWQETIRPRRTELAYDGIPWHPRLAEGFLAANEAQKPVLLWVMNGHPLGCT